MYLARVLVIEDDAAAARDIVRSIEGLGFEVSAVTNNGETAIALAGNLKPDLAIIDVELGGKPDGIETGDKLYGMYDIPVVYISARSDEEILERSKTTNPYGFLLKPLNVRDLNGCLRMAIFRKESETRLKESEEKYFRLAENARDMVYRMSLPEGKYLYVNKASQNLTGYTPQEFISNPLLISEIIHPEWKHYFEVKWSKLLEGDMDDVYEYQIIHKDGSTKWLNQRNVLIRAVNGSSSVIEGIVTDVTEQKKAEALIRRQNEEYRFIFDAIPAMVLLKDTKNKILRANKLCATYLGKRIDELEGKYIDELFPEQADEYYRQDMQVITSGEPIHDIVEGFVDAVKGKVWLKYDKYPYRNEKSEVVGVIVMTQDITRQVEMEKQLGEAEAKNTALLNTIPDLLFQYSRDCRIVGYKARNESDLYAKPVEFMNRRIDEILPEEIGKNFRILIEKVFGTGEIESYEYEIVINGDLRDFEVRFVKVTDDEVLGIIRDISDRKKIEAALKESELRYKNLVQNAPIALTRYLPLKKIFQFSNAEMERQAGYSLDELNRMSDEEFVSMMHADDRDSVMKEYAEWGSTGMQGVKHLMYRIINKAGNIVWLDSYHYADFDSEGKVEAVNQIYIEITEQKRIADALMKSEKQYRDLASNAPIGVSRLVIQSNKYDFLNEEFERFTGFNMDELNEMSVKELDELVFEEDRVMARNEFRQWRDASYKGVKTIDYRIVTKSKEVIWLNSFVYADFDDEGKLIHINQICLDDTKRRIQEIELKQSEEKFRAVSESMRAQIVIFQDEKFVYINPYSEILTGYSEAELLEKDFWELIHPDDKQLSRERGIARQRGEDVPNEYEMRLITKFGDTKWLYYSAVMITYLGRPAVLGIAFDISDRKRYEDELKKSEERYRAFLSQSSEGIYRLELLSPISIDLPAEDQAKLIYKFSYFAEANEVFARMLGFENAEELTGKRIAELNKDNEEFYLALFKKFIKNDYRIDEFEIEKDFAAGKRRYYLENAAGITERGMLYRIWFTRQDITEEKSAEEMLKKSVSEKDILLKEIHHRVKNNLQIVSSLLKLQSQYIKDKQVVELFRESQNRVHSMSIIHQKLYQTRDLSNVNFGEYTAMLSSHLLQSFGINSEQVKVNVSSGKILMSLENAIPAGLIINELVTNSLKHAFGEGGGWIIDINVEFDEDTRFFVIMVKDNGAGIPHDFDISESSSFGLKLVQTLTEQMHGKLSFENSNGTCFMLRFPSADYKQRS